MSEQLPAPAASNTFERIKRVNESGAEFWSARELARVLAYVRQLQEVDVSMVAPTAHAQVDRQPLRADDPRPSLPHELALREAPVVSQDGFAVPSFVEEG